MKRCASVTTSSTWGDKPVTYRVRCFLKHDHDDRHHGRVPGSHGVIWRRQRVPTWLAKALAGLTARQRRLVQRRYLRQQP